MISNSRVLLTAGPFQFAGTLDYQSAPAAAAWLIEQFPLKGSLQHASWSGEAAWLPIPGSPHLPPENATAYPRPGQVLLYAGLISHAELLIPYGACAFASKAGTLAGSPVVTLDDSPDNLRALGSLLLAKGRQPMTLDRFNSKESS